VGEQVRQGRFVFAVIGLLLAGLLMAQLCPAQDLQAAAGPRLYFPLVRRAFPPLPGVPWLHGIDNADGDGNYTVRWDAAERANEYELQEQWQGGDWLTAHRGAGTEVELRDRPAGSYAYRCRGLNGWGYGQWSNTQGTTVQGRAPGTISRPSSSPVNAGGNSVVKVINDCPYVLRLTFTGPDPRVMELPKCDVCHVYSFIGPIFCPTTGRPVSETQLQPGVYRVFVTVSDPSVRPYVGNWDLSGDRRYTVCFYILQTWGSAPEGGGEIQPCE
jgi:hypothetical protein